MLLPTNQDFWIEPAIDRLRSEGGEVSQKSLILLLWYAQTESADKAIVDFVADASKPASVRAYAKQIVQAKSKIDPKQKVEASGLSEATLRRKRQERMNAVSDEALYDLDDYTLMLASQRK